MCMFNTQTFLNDNVNNMKALLSLPMVAAAMQLKSAYNKPVTAYLHKRRVMCRHKKKYATKAISYSNFSLRSLLLTVSIGGCVIHICCYFAFFPLS